MPTVIKAEAKERTMMHFTNITTTCATLALPGLMICECAAQLGPRQVQSFDTTWRFCAGDIIGAKRPEYNDASWLTVDVPHDWSIQGLAKSENNGDSAE